MSLRLFALIVVLALGWNVSAQAQDEDASEVELSQVLDGTFFVTWADARVRSEPDSTSTIVAELGFGDRVTVTGEVAGGPWYRVSTEDGTVGYVWSEVLAPAVIALPGGPQGGGGSTGDAPGGPSHGPSADNSFENANPVGPLTGTPQVFEGFVGPADEVDYYRIEIDDWTDIHITMDMLTSDADIALLDTDGNYLADSIAGGSSAESIDVPVGPGTYYLEVYIFSGETDYRLSITGTPGTPPPADEVGNTRETANNLGIIDGPTSFGDWVGPGDDDDYWRFELTSQAFVTITMTGMSSDLDIVLEDDFGSVLNSSAAGGSDDELMESTLEPGVYYIRVYPFSGASDYEIMIDVAIEPTEGSVAPPDSAGNTPESSADLGVLGTTPVTLTDWLGPDDVADYYRFELAEPADVVITLTPESGDVDLELLSADDESYLGGSIRPETESENVELSLPAGAYVIRAYIFDGESDYELTVSR
ncbi:MAG: pre-peptidase C-terminal domain-containing protein [Pseudomonadota bacterium]